MIPSEAGGAAAGNKLSEAEAGVWADSRQSRRRRWAVGTGVWAAMSQGRGEWAATNEAEEAAARQQVGGDKTEAERSATPGRSKVGWQTKTKARVGCPRQRADSCASCCSPAKMWVEATRNPPKAGVGGTET